jgi:hypothetical protein
MKTIMNMKSLKLQQLQEAEDFLVSWDKEILPRTLLHEVNC